MQEIYDEKLDFKYSKNDIHDKHTNR